MTQVQLAPAPGLLSFPPISSELMKFISPNALFERERELQYIVPLSRLQNVMNVAALSSASIRQQYFSADLVDSIVGAICERQKISPRAIRDIEFTSARLRTITVGNTVTHVLQAKGPKQKERQGSARRPEMSTPILGHEYAHFSEQACEGVVDKVRLLTHGVVHQKKIGRVMVIGEIDIFRSIGVDSLETCLSQRHDFARIDIELPSPKLMKPFRRGAHTLDFLKCCGAVELRDCPKEVRKAFSTRRLASAGVDHRFLDALAKIRELSALAMAA